MYYYGFGVGLNHSEAIKWFRKAAEQGLVEAQYQLGELFYRNLNYMEAFKWYSKAAKNGHAKAQFELGLMYHYGYGVAKNLDKARKWYKRAVENGESYAQELLGDLKQIPAHDI